MQQNAKTNIEDIYELTAMQQGMLFHTLYTKDSDTYIEQFCYTLSGELDEDNFRKAWEETVSRHGVLRTSFQWKGISKPVQIVSKSVILPWENLDWTSLSEEQKKDEFKKFINTDRMKRFSMEDSPLMRCTLIKTSSSTYEFVWTFHHILMDGWSYPIIQREVFSFYEAMKNGNMLSQAEPISYKQFVVWYNNQDKSQSEAYWRKELMSFESPTKLTSHEIRTKSSAHMDETESISTELSQAFTQKLQEYSRQHQITLNTIIQSAWAYLLSVYSGENDVVFGGVVSGRNPSLQGIDKMVGLFINTLPVRVKIDYDKRVIDWLKEMQREHLERDEYSYSSLVDIQEYSGIPRGTQLFENILVFENYPLDKSFENGIAGIKINNLRAYERTNFPMTVLISPGDSLKITIAYETEKFSAETIRQILTNFEIALQNITSDHSQKISDLTLLTQEEKLKILVEWNNSKHDFPSGKRVYDLIEEQSARTPDAVAVEFGNKKLTYKELEEKSNQLANYLRRCGVKPNDVVGICVERSIEMIISLYGILKSGAAYLPLDSSFPAERISFMLGESNAAIIVTQEKFLEKLKKENLNFILVDKDSDKIASESKLTSETETSPKNLAYVMFTSGSTGKPKGVLMKHEALVNLLNWQTEGQNFASGYRTLQFTTLSFDVSFQEIFSTLYTGGTLVILGEEDRKDLSRVLKIIKDKKIQRIFLAYIALQEIAEIYSSGKEGKLELKEIYTAGEQVQNTQAVINFFNHLNGFTFTNQYGPTEAHVVTYFELPSNTKDWMKLPPIGKPIYNVQMYVLNSQMEPLPPGVIGNLYIGGISLAEGYINRPELTAEKFIGNPAHAIDKNSSKKIYKTGDLARYLLDGTLEYLGRNDSQIKLRGYRIELGEIESVLSEHPEIKNAIVVTRDISHGDKRLIAYLISKNGTEADPREIKNFLKSKLPDYMIPSDYVFIKEIPLTSSGKIDHKSLPIPEVIRTKESEAYTQPNDALEMQLVKIWEKVLGIHPIGIKDNFFELGGHSLLALRVFGYIEKLTGKKLALSVLFDSPTIEKLSALIKDDGWKPAWKSLVAVKPGGSKLPFFCVPPAAGTALHFQGLVKYLPKDQPFYVLESVGLDGKETPHNNVEEMAEFYVKEIQSLQPEGPYLLGGRCFGGRVVFEMAQQFARLGQKVALLAIFDTWPPFTETPTPYIPFERDMKHFVTRTLHHLKKGELISVINKYSYSKFVKIKWKVTNKIEYIFSNEKKRLFKKIMFIHFDAQDKYLAKRFPGKITLIECASYKPEFRERWRQLGGEGFETYVIPETTHKTIVKEPKLREFAEKLNYILEKTHNEIRGNISSNGSTKKIPADKDINHTVIKS